MHVVNPHWVSGTRRRCQAIAVLISLQLCLISSVEANHLTVGKLGSPDTRAVDPTWRRQWRTSHFILLSLLSNAFLILNNSLHHTPLKTSCWELPGADKLHRFSLGGRAQPSFFAVPLWAQVILWSSVIYLLKNNTLTALSCRLFVSRDRKKLSWVRVVGSFSLFTN